MAKRKIGEVVGKVHTVHIRYDSEWKEYTARIVGKPECDYYTDSRSDAFGTADAMANGVPNIQVR
jgi:hypothetical protein